MKERATRQLTAVLDVVRRAADHPTADEVFRRVQQQVPRVSLGTVYRNLQKLVARDQVRRVTLKDQVTRYDGMLDAHDHFQCDECGQLSDLVPTAAVQLSALRAEGYRVDSHSLTIHGACPACLAKTSRGRGSAREVRVRPRKEVRE